MAVDFQFSVLLFQNSMHKSCKFRCYTFVELVLHFYIYTLELLLYNFSRRMTGSLGKLVWSLVLFFVILYRRCIFDIKFLGRFSISCGTKIHKSRYISRKIPINIFACLLCCHI
jgi:hypothetical protein